MKHQKHLDLEGLKAAFPWDQYPEMRDNQKKALEMIAKENGSVTLELPTGSGKTALGFTVLKALQNQGGKGLFYLAPTKTIVEQVKKLHPEVKVIFGRNEYPCLYYQKEKVTADEAPCSMLECPHRVNQETGETEVIGILPCPYLQAKYEAKQGGIIVCTMSFYLFTQLFVREWEEPAGLVIDEVHRLASVARNSLSYEITDYQLSRAVELLTEVDLATAQILQGFLKKMTRIIKRKPVQTPALLKDNEIQDLLKDLIKINPKELEKNVKTFTKKQKIDPDEQREILKKIEVLCRNLHRYLRSLEFSLSTAKRKPLNYTYAYYKKELGKDERVQYRLFIKCYYVAPLISRILPPLTVAYSATIGEAEILEFETGITAPFYTLPSDFPVDHTRIFLPKDTANLALKSRNHQDVTRSLRRIAKTCRFFADSDLRSLVVVVSEKERQKFLWLCQEEKVEAVSYGNGIKPKEAASQFKAGKGEVLVGTVANFGEGIDLPKNLAPIIFFFRPGYPSPQDPVVAFEEKRYGSLRWKIWNWRVMIEALQARGRNIRSADDLGVTFFISQQFRRFLFASLPEWLKDSYKGDLNFEQCVNQAKSLLSGKS